MRYVGGKQCPPQTGAPYLSSSSQVQIKIPSLPLDSTGFVCAALRLRRGVHSVHSVHSVRGHSSQWVLFHQTRHVTARSFPEASRRWAPLKIGCKSIFDATRCIAPGRKWTGQSIQSIPQKRLLQTLSLRSLSSRRRNASVLLRFTGSV